MKWAWILRIYDSWGMYVADVTTECDLKLILTSGSYAGYALGRVIMLVSLLRYVKTGDEVLGCNYILWGYPNLCKPEKLLQVVTNCNKQNHAQYKPTEYIGRNMMETVCVCAGVFIQRTHTHIYIYYYHHHRYYYYIYICMSIQPAVISPVLAGPHVAWFDGHSVWALTSTGLSALYFGVNSCLSTPCSWSNWPGTPGFMPAGVMHFAAKAASSGSMVYAES